MQSAGFRVTTAQANRWSIDGDPQRGRRPQESRKGKNKSPYTDSNRPREERYLAVIPQSDQGFPVPIFQVGQDNVRGKEKYSVKLWSVTAPAQVFELKYLQVAEASEEE